MATKPTIINRIEAHYKIQLDLSTKSLEDFMRYGSRDQDKNKYLLDGEVIIGLNLRTNDLTEFPFLEDEELHQIQALYLCENKLPELTIPKEMSNLVYLDVGDNEALKVVRFEGDMPQLKSIELSDSGVETLNIPNCSSLEKIDVSRNQLREFSFSSACPTLWWLDLSGNENLKSIYFPSGFNTIKFIYLYKCGVEELVIDGAMPVLKVLDLEGNKLKRWPKGFLLSETVETLYLSENPITDDIPETIMGTGDRNNSAENVRNYLLSIQKEDEVHYLHEGKMVLIGNGLVGKTSIRRKLLDRSAALPTLEERTEGLDVEIIPYPIKDLPPNVTGLDAPIDFKLNIWDFGGQSRYREVQQLLCSPKTLYLFVTSVNDDPSNDSEYVNFDYWYTMVRALSNDEQGKPSPVIHVTNKLDLQESYFSKSLGQISVPVKLQISAKSLKNFELLAAAIKSTLHEVGDGIFTDRFNINWLNVKSELESRSAENHITYGQYVSLCEQHEMSAGDARTWLTTLVRIGTVIFFDDINNPNPNDWVILNPNWVTKAIFQIIDSKKKRKLTNPVSREQLLGEWEDKSTEEKERLITLMKNFHLLFEQTNDFKSIEYIIPALLTDKEPDLSNILPLDDLLNEVRFTYAPIIPAGTVHKLIVRMRDDLYDSRIMWKNNVILFDKGNNIYAHVCEDWRNKRVYVKFYGKDPSALFQKIKNNLDALNLEFTQAQIISELQQTFEVRDYTGWKSFGSDIKLDGHTGFSFWKQPKEKVEKKVYFSFYQKKIAEDNQDLLAKNLADQLEEKIKEYGATVMRQDLSVEYGGSTEEYSKQIGKASLIIPFIDDAYLKDINRMFELIEVYRNSKQEKSDFIQRLMPVFTEEFNFQEASTFLTYLKHWKSKQQEWEELKQFNIKDLYNDLNKVIKINENIGNVLNWLRDVYPNADLIFDIAQGEKLLPGIQKRISAMDGDQEDLYSLVKKMDDKMDDALRGIDQLNENDQAIIRKMDLQGEELQNLSQLFIRLEKEEVDPSQLEEMLGKIDTLMEEATKKDQTIANKWIETKAKQQEYPEFKGKFKTTIPIIPFVLRYETELGLDLTKMARNIWRKGIVF